MKPAICRGNKYIFSWENPYLYCLCLVELNTSLIMICNLFFFYTPIHTIRSYTEAWWDGAGLFPGEAERHDEKMIWVLSLSFSPWLESESCDYCVTNCCGTDRAITSFSHNDEWCSDNEGANRMGKGWRVKMWKGEGRWTGHTGNFYRFASTCPIPALWAVTNGPLTALCSGWIQTCWLEKYHTASPLKLDRSLPSYTLHMYRPKGKWEGIVDQAMLQTGKERSLNTTEITSRSWAGDRRE